MQFIMRVIAERLGTMTQQQIKSEYQAIRERMRVLEQELDAERARIKVNQAYCRHPNGYPTSCMGDSGYHCPDCGHSR